jgi:asparagine synthase (glutamine-hydrolysing)
MNIVGIVGLCPGLRQNYLSGLDSGIRIFDWLKIGRWELPSSSIVCALNSLERVSVQRTQSAACLCLGAVRQTKGLPDQFLSDLDRSDLDGDLHLTFTSGEDGCSVGTDPLGLFPLYYYSTAEFFLFSSSLWPFRRHPRVRAALDVDGLIGICLSQGIVGGRTLLQGVTRLSAGHRVAWRPGQLATEHHANRLRPTADLFNATFDEQIDVVDAALRSATARRNGDLLLLSGGLDSRLVAGYLSATHGPGFPAISLGSPRHFDVKFAQQVAGRLAWHHRAVDIDVSSFLDHAMVEVRHEQLSASFADLSFWQLVVDLRQSDPALITGFCGNNVLEPFWDDPRRADFSFAHAFQACNSYGFRPDTLRRLLRVQDVDENISAVIERLREEYESFDCEPFQRVLMFGLSHRARFHIGAVVSRLAFGVRPLLPYADQDLLKAALALPVTAFQARRLQKTLLCRRFPDLARLPLDTATFFTRPLMPTFVDRVRHLSLLAYHGLISREERRYYHSMFDLNGAGWRFVRAEAEKSRSKAESILDRDTLRRLLPPPDEEIRTGVTDFFKAGSRMKTLLAFMLWSSEHL